MNNPYCTYGDNCKFWHPTGLKDFRLGHERKEHYSKEEIPTESRGFYGKNHSYLRQQDISKIIGRSCLRDGCEAISGLARRLEQIEIQIQIQNKQLLNPQRLSTATYIVSTASMSDGELDNDDVFNS